MQRIGVLMGRSESDTEAKPAWQRSAAQTRGWVEGRTVQIDVLLAGAR
jgi:hypothetical protein